MATLLLHTERESSTAAVSWGHNITEAEALRARRDMVYAQHQVGSALDQLRGGRRPLGLRQRPAWGYSARV